MSRAASRCTNSCWRFAAHWRGLRGCVSSFAHEARRLPGGRRDRAARSLLVRRRPNRAPPKNPKKQKSKSRNRPRPQHRSTSATVPSWRPGRRSTGKPIGRRPRNAGGIYFKLGNVYSDAAVRAKVTKPDPAAYVAFTKQADEASQDRDRVLHGSRAFSSSPTASSGATRRVMTYDPLATQNGDRLKSAEAAIQAAQPCAELYKSCPRRVPAGLQRLGDAHQLDFLF